MDKWVELQQRRIVSKIPFKGESLLDVGCGAGDYLKIFAEKLPKENLAGLDIFKAEIPGIETFKGTAEKLPFKAKSFDIVFEKDTLHHIENKKKALQEMKRVARKEVILVEANLNNPSLDRFIDKRVHKHFSPASLRAFLKGEKFEMYFVEAFPFGSNKIFPLKILNILPDFMARLKVWPINRIFDLMNGDRAAFIVCRISAQ